MTDQHPFPSGERRKLPPQPGFWPQREAPPAHVANTLTLQTNVGSFIILHTIISSLPLCLISATGFTINVMVFHFKSVLIICSFASNNKFCIEFMYLYFIGGDNGEQDGVFKIKNECVKYRVSSDTNIWSFFFIIPTWGKWAEACWMNFVPHSCGPISS